MQRPEPGIARCAHGQQAGTELEQSEQEKAGETGVIMGHEEGHVEMVRHLVLFWVRREQDLSDLNRE